MQKAYSRTTWENYPSDNTPLNETNLNNLEAGVDEIDNRVISLDTTKFDKTEAAGLIKTFELDKTTGIITVTKYNGSVTTIDTLLEKIAVNFDFDSATQKLVITLDDGTTKEIDLSAFITQYEFLDSDTIGFTVDSAGKVTAIVKEGSIEEKHLQPNYLADIKTEVAKAEASKTAAALSETNAKASETNAKISETNAKESETNAETSANTATEKATAAADSATSAENSATTATEKETAAQASAEAAKTSEENAKESETNAASSANTATEKATAAVNSAIEAESFAHGGTGTRTDEEIDNARYYYQQAKSISESFSGALKPMGTVTFANLPSVSNATDGDMYNISDEFVTTSDFKEGSGLTIPEGSNIYKTVDGKWDILAGSPVTGIKGNKESTYRKGNVNITPQNIGAADNIYFDVDTSELQLKSGNEVISTAKIETGGIKIVTWADGSWKDIEIMLNLHYLGVINIADYWAVGDKRNISLDGTDYEFVIMDFDHYDLSTSINGKTTAAVVIGMVDCFGTKYSMNSSNTNVGGWTNSVMRISTMSTMEGYLPEALQNLTKQVQTKTSAGNKSTTIETNNDYCFLPSEIEVFGTTAISVSGEGTQLEYYKTISNRIKKYNGNNSNWWLRSPYSNNSYYFDCATNSTDHAYSNSGSASLGLSFCLCI